MYTEKIKKHIFNFDLSVDKYYGYRSGNDPKRIALNGALGVWNNDEYIIEETIDDIFYWVKKEDGSTLKYKIEEELIMKLF